MTQFGLRGLLGSVSPIETFRADQAIVGLSLNPVALGLYVVAQAFTNLPRAAASSIGYVAYPRVASSAVRHEAQREMWKYFFVGVAVSGALVGVLVLMSDALIRLFFGSEFTSAVPVAQILLLGTFFSSVRRVLTDGLRGLGHPGLGTVAEVSCWIVLVPAVVVLLPRGATGVALALTLAWAASLGVAIVFAVRESTALFDIWLARLRSSLVLLVASVAVVIAVGVAAASLSLRGALALVLLVLGGLFFSFSRAMMKPKLDFAADEGSRPAPSTRVDHRVATRIPQPPDLRLPRAIYYFGVLLLALLTVRASGQVTWSDVLFLLSMMLAFAELAIIRRNVPITIPLLLLGGMTIFTIGGLLLSLVSYAPLNSVSIVVRLIFLTVFWFWLGTVVLVKREHVHTALVLWVTSAAICGAGAVVQLVVGDVIPNTHLVYGRSTGFTGQPNDLGGLCAIAFIPAVMLTARAGLSASRRLVCYLLLLLVTAGLVLSGSVGAMSPHSRRSSSGLRSSGAPAGRSFRSP